MPWLIGILILAGAIYGFSGDSKDELITPVSTHSGLYEESSSYSLFSDSYDEDSYEEHNDDVNRYENLGGTYTVEACSSNSGNCYDLDADIEGGGVERIYFPNGGHLDLDGAELDEGGYATGESYTWSEGYNGDEWEINCYDCE